MNISAVPLSTFTSESSHGVELDIQSLQSILASRQELESLVQLQGGDAVAVVEALDRALDSPNLTHAQRKRCSFALRKLCGTCGILPESYTLTDGLEKTSDFPHASGGFADVWPGRYKGRLVAIKALKTYATDDLAKVKKRFCKEALVWKRLSHPNILPFLGVSHSPFLFCIVSIWMTHGNIITYVKSHHDANRLLLLSDVASGLKYLHTSDLIHGDLKGANILISNDYRACIADFGLMVIMPDTLTAHSISTTGGGGTLRWMAPELLMPEEHGFTRCLPSKESDMYAVGMVVYEVMTGNIPFHNCKNNLSVIPMVRRGDRPERPKNSVVTGFSDDLWHLVEICWHQKRNQRPSISLVLDNLNVMTRYWIPPSPGTTDSILGTENVSDVSSAISKTSFPAEQHEIQRQQAQDSITMVKPSFPYDVLQVKIDKQISIAEDASVTRSSAHTVPTISLDLTHIPFDESIFTTLETSSCLEVLETNNKSSFRSFRGAPVAGSDKSDTLTRIANDLLHTFRRTQKVEDLQESITHYRRALALRPQGHRGRSESLNGVAVALVDRFRWTAKFEDVEEAIAHHRQALVLRPPGHPCRSESLNNMASALLNRFRMSRELNNLEEAITLHRQALTLLPPGHPDRSLSLNNIAAALVDRFGCIHALDDMEEAITLYREALLLCSSGHPDRSALLHDIATTLVDRFTHTQKLESLEEAITNYREALTLRPPGHHNRFESLNGVAFALIDRFRRFYMVKDLEDATQSFREVLTLCPPGHPYRSMSLNNIAAALLERFRRSYEPKYLEEAIIHLHKALALRPRGHSGRSTSLNNLAATLVDHFKWSHKLECLDEAITHYREALVLRPLGHAGRSVSLNGASTALLCRFRWSHKVEDLEETITHHREVLVICPPGHPARSVSLNNIAAALVDRYKWSRNLEDLEEAIKHHRERFLLRPPGNPDQ